MQGNYEDYPEDHLRYLGEKNYTSKVPYGYLEIYEDLWKKYGRYKSDLTLLEIGVYNGNSMRVWNEWFPNATIVGIDHNKDNPMEVGRAQVHFGWQEDPVFLNAVAKNYDGFDIIIDDGGHIARDQLVSFETLWPYVKPHGMYIIEDLHAENSIRSRDIEETVESAITGGSTVKSVEFYRSLVVIHKV